MNFAHLHLILTHFPPVMSLGGAMSAVAGILLPRRRRELIQLALLLLIAVGAMMPLVFIAGNRTADRIGKVEGIDQDAIAPHQRAAKIALWVSIAVAIIAIVVANYGRALRVPTMVLVLVIAIVSAAVIGWTAALGGAIHHPEIAKKV